MKYDSMNVFFLLLAASLAFAFLLLFGGCAVHGLKLEVNDGYMVSGSNGIPVLDLIP